MMYCSTRSNNSTNSSTRSTTFSAEEALWQGAAPDGGLFVPHTLPQIKTNTLSGLAYPAIAQNVISPFFPGFTIASAIQKAYCKNNFAASQIVPLQQLDALTYIMELWHGPTCAFKDVALQLLPHLLSEAAIKLHKKNKLVMLVATSGDTGSAALCGFRNLPGTEVIVFYPEKNVSLVQKLQMTTMEGQNISVIGLREGDFDAAQSGIKSIFGDADFIDSCKQQGIDLCSANSINWGRLVPQIVYYFTSYLYCRESFFISTDEKLDVVVPTGNFGNIMAAWYAKAMGLPLGTLIVASNSNSVLSDFFSHGVYNKNRPLLPTCSPSMDILISSNLERLLYEVSGHNGIQISYLMQDLAQKGYYTVDSNIKDALKKSFFAGYTSEEETITTIRNTYLRHKMLIDPHTAVALNVLQQYRRIYPQKKAIVASTANPFKFNASMIKAILPTYNINGKNEFQLQDELSLHCSNPIPQVLCQLRNKKVVHSESCLPSEMKAVLAKKLKVAI